MTMIQRTTGFGFEITHTHDCLATGLKESPLFPLAESLRLQEIMDEARRQIGLVYPGEGADG